jgi:hypothetical protein
MVPPCSSYAGVYQVALVSSSDAQAADPTSECGDPADIQLTDLLEIAIVIGTPPAEIPSAFPTA